MSIIDFIKSEPVAIAFGINAALEAAVQFGLDLGPARLVAINVLVAALLTIITRQNVTPIKAVAFNMVNFPPQPAPTQAPEPASEP